MKYTDVLHDIGFSKKEISVYQSLLALDSAIVSDIAKQANIKILILQ